jgi:hypothetical protein
VHPHTTASASRHFRRMPNNCRGYFPNPDIRPHFRHPAVMLVRVLKHLRTVTWCHIQVCTYVRQMESVWNDTHTNSGCTAAARHCI